MGRRSGWVNGMIRKRFRPVGESAAGLGGCWKEGKEQRRSRASG